MAGWDYKNHPNFSDNLLRSRAQVILNVLYSRSASQLIEYSQDTRALHKFYFSNLTPPAEPYFAGNYRGSHFPLLENYKVRFGPNVGIPPYYVSLQMMALADNITRAYAQLDLAWAVDEPLSPAAKLAKLVEVTAAIFVAFLTIHPYADGNGHMSRFIVLMALGRFDFKRVKMPIHPRPLNFPPLDQMIENYRLGNRALLEQYFLKTL